MALQTEIWIAELAKNIFKNNSFLRRSKNDDSFVENKVVHLPQSGAVPNTKRNRVILPAPIVQRTDVDETYNMVEFTSDPTLITDIDSIEVSYDKRRNVLEEHEMTLNDEIADYVPYQWAPTVAAQVVPTSGSDRPAIAPGATGTRKKFTKADILKAKAILDRQNIPNEGRYLLLSSDMYNDLLTDSELLSREFMATPNLENGTVGKIFGFDIYIRSLVGRYATGNTVVKDPVAADAATDNAYGLAWHSSFVRAALGSIKVYADEDKPEYYGSIFSTMARAGAHKSYTNQRGVVAIAEIA